MNYSLSKLGAVGRDHPGAFQPLGIKPQAEDAPILLGVKPQAYIAPLQGIKNPTVQPMSTLIKPSPVVTSMPMINDFSFVMPNFDLGFNFGMPPIMPAPVLTKPAPIVAPFVMPNLNLDFGFPNLNLDFIKPIINPAPINFTPTDMKPQMINPIIPRTIQPVVTDPMSFSGVNPKTLKTISLVVKNEYHSLPGANISVNGVATAVTDSRGMVTLPNIPWYATIKISYIGYQDFEGEAGTIPTEVVLKQGTIMLNEVVIPAKSKTTEPAKAKSNTLVWLIAAGVAALGLYKYSKGSKVVKAKI